jgi:hypothetical protein
LKNLIYDVYFNFFQLKRRTSPITKTGMNYNYE